jgi:hypothetical protein
MKIGVPPNNPKPSVNIPVTVPDLYEIFKASLKLLVAAYAVLMLPCTASTYPLNIEGVTFKRIFKVFIQNKERQCEENQQSFSTLIWVKPKV